MDFLQLKYFKKVAECKSMTQAARELRVAPPAISRTIGNLEKTIGFPVFDRQGRSIVLNQNGEILLEHVENIFGSMRNALDEIRDRNNQDRNVSVQLRAASKLFPDIVSRFMRENPEFRLYVDQAKVASRGYDLTIYASGEPAKKEGHYQLLREKILVVVPVGHPLAGKSSVEAADLKGEVFLSLSKGSDFRGIIDKLCERLGFVPQFTFEFDNPSFLREMLVASMGITFLPEITWGANNTSQTKALELKGGPFFRHINIAWDPARYLPVMARRFRDFIIEYYEDISARGSC